jgi:hypothetical protein
MIPVFLTFVICCVYIKLTDFDAAITVKCMILIDETEREKGLKYEDKCALR